MGTRAGSDPAAESGPPITVRPELVEGLYFFSASEKEEGRGFDKLSPNGCFTNLTYPAFPYARGWALR